MFSPINKYRNLKTSNRQQQAVSKTNHAAQQMLSNKNKILQQKSVNNPNFEGQALECEPTYTEASRQSMDNFSAINIPNRMQFVPVISPVNSEPIQATWINNSGIYEWHTLQDGVRWFFNPETKLMSFKIENAQKVPAQHKQFYEQYQNQEKSRENWLTITEWGEEKWTEQDKKVLSSRTFPHSEVKPVMEQWLNELQKEEKLDDDQKVARNVLGTMLWDEVEVDTVTDEINTPQGVLIKRKSENNRFFIISWITTAPSNLPGNQNRIKGVGTALLSPLFAVADAQNLGIKVSPEGEGAEAFYRALGFVKPSHGKELWRPSKLVRELIEKDSINEKAIVELEWNYINGGMDKASFEMELSKFG